MDCKRIIYLDYLRVLAMLAVMILHIACMGFHELDGSSLEWQILNFYDGIVRWGVPVFVMISGTLFLSKDINKFHIYIYIYISYQFATLSGQYFTH